MTLNINEFSSANLGKPEKPRLLIVDDQPVNIRILHELFRDDCEVFMATNGEQALTLCTQHIPDLILLDVVMPGMNGHEVCKKLKENALTNHIPIIFVTSQQDEVDEARGLELGAVDFISKPVHPTIVSARVKTHLTLKFQSDALRLIASKDSLTGLDNRRKFDEDIDKSWRGCWREESPLSLILLDIDYFKRYNDNYGHIGGDQCLKLVAETLQQVLKRPNDTLARYGGEEFVCILPNTDLEGAQRVSEDMLQAIKAKKITHNHSLIDQILTVSLGVVSCIPKATLSVDEFIKAADEQLYEAKAAGRARMSHAMFG